jgi:hypothetical protein
MEGYKPLNTESFDDYSVRWVTIIGLWSHLGSQGLERGGYNVKASHAAAVKADKEMKQKNSETVSTYAKEEADLDEAKVVRTKRTPEQQAKVDRMVKSRLQKSKAARAAQAASGQVRPAKAKAYVSPETDEKGKENETPNDDPRENIINQLRKLPVEGKHRITFKNGKTHLLPTSIVNKARTLHGNMHPSKKGDFQERLAASLESFQDAVKNPENEAPKPKGRDARLAPKPLGKNFMDDLDRVARGGPPKR